MPKQKNFPGEKFGLLKILSREGPHAICRCDCGNIEPKRVLMGNLKSGRTTSCGCEQKKMYGSKKPRHKSLMADELEVKLKNMHTSMKQQCGNPHNPRYKNYGAYGCKVAPEWEAFSDFVVWAATRYKPNQFLVLKKPGDFCPQNCEFVPKTGNLHRTWIMRDAAQKAEKKKPAAAPRTKRTDDGMPLMEAVARTNISYKWFEQQMRTAHNQGLRYTAADAKRQAWEHLVGVRL